MKDVIANKHYWGKIDSNHFVWLMKIAEDKGFPSQQKRKSEK